MKKKAFAALLLVIMALSFCSAFAESQPQIGDTLKSLADGHLRHPFEQGYTGFCIAWPSPDACADEEYIVVSPENLYNTSNKHVADFYNYLKVYATQFSDHFLNTADYSYDVQHLIWHFSNDFTGWRVDPDLVNDITVTAATMTIPDHYVQQLDGMTRTWDFIILANKEITSSTDRPLFFAYKYTDKSTVPETGDSASPVLWGLLLAVSAIGVAVVSRKTKKAY